MEVDELVALLNEQQGTSYVLRGQLEGGTRGAWEMEALDGSRAVLKRGWGEHLPRIRRVVDALRARGYPAPRFLYGGTVSGGGSYHVTELLPGLPVPRMTDLLLRQIMDLVELQADVRPATDMVHVAGPAGATICIAYQVINQVAFAIQSLPLASIERYTARSHQMLALASTPGC